MSCKILSIDGGGMRGVIPAYLLTRLESEIGSLHEKFDMFAGTSTGSIIAAALACGAFTASDILDLYHTRGRDIFSRPLISTGGWFGPRYLGSALEGVLKSKLGDRRMGAVAERGKRLIVPVFDGYGRKPLIFDSHDPRDPDRLLRDVCRASSAAPTYFPAHILATGGVDTPLLDGGLVANNPSSLAVARSLQAGHNVSDVLLISLGCGQVRKSTNANKIKRQLLGWGRVHWALPIISLLMDASGPLNEEICQTLLPQNFYRFQVPLSSHLDAIDQTATNHLDSLVVEAKNYWEESPTTNQVKALKQALSLRVSSDDTQRDFAGRWRSSMRWCEAARVEAIADLKELKLSGEEQGATIELEQDGERVTGQTIDSTTEWPFSLNGMIYGGHDLVGEQRGRKTGLISHFMVRLDLESGKRTANGFWFGQGNAGLFAGTWMIERLDR